MAAFSPVQDTWARSVERELFNTWPGPTEKDIKKMPKSEAKIKGHIAQIKNHACSTTTNKNIGYEHTNTDSIKEQYNNKT